MTIDERERADGRRPLPHRRLPGARGLRHVRRRLRRPPGHAPHPDARGLRRASRSAATSRWAASRCCSPSTSTSTRAGMTDQDPLAVPYRERERSVTMERMGEDDELHDELFTLNIGPHHPATHGVLRLLTHARGRGRARHQADHRLRPHRHREELRGPAVLEGHHVRRADGLPRLLLQRDRLLHGGRDAARHRGAAARAVPARGPHGAEPDRLAPVRARHRRARPGRDHDALVGLPRPRPRARPVRDVVRPAHAPALHPGRRRLRGHPAGLGARRCASSSRSCRRASTSTRHCSTATRSGSSGSRAPAC